MFPFLPWVFFWAIYCLFWADSLQRQLEHDNNKTFKSISTLFFYLNMQRMNFFIENQFFHFDLPWKQPMLHSFVHVFSLAYFPMGEVWRKSNIENSLIHFHYGSVQYYFVYVRLEKRVFKSRVTFIIYFTKKILFFRVLTTEMTLHVSI